MGNPILKSRADRSVAKALKEALKAPKTGGGLSFNSIMKIIKAAHDDDIVTDVEYRDLKQILRTRQIWGPARFLLEWYIEVNYPLKGPFVYPGNLDDLENKGLVGTHQCAALVQNTVNVGLTATWREGMRVRGNGTLIKKGTAVATFVDGYYPNLSHGNHVAYYVSQDSTGIVVMDQWTGKESVASRLMPFRGQHASGLFVDPSNNGDALSVIMNKK